MRTPVAALAIAAAGCSAASIATPPDVTGTYALVFVDGANGCNLPGWGDGGAHPGVALAISQQALVTQNACAVLGGAPGALMTKVVGSDVTTGTVSGPPAQITLSATGSVDQTRGNCSYTTTPTLSLSFTGNTVQGTLTYTDVTNGATDCNFDGGTLGGCQSVQAIAGVFTSPDAGAGCDGGTTADAAAQGG